MGTLIGSAFSSLQNLYNLMNPSFCILPFPFCRLYLQVKSIAEPYNSAQKNCRTFNVLQILNINVQNLWHSAKNGAYLPLAEPPWMQFLSVSQSKYNSFQCWDLILWVTVCRHNLVLCIKNHSYDVFVFLFQETFLKYKVQSFIDAFN